MFAFGMPGTTEWVVILVIVLIFFGAGKLPDVFRQAGKGIKAFKDASEGKDEADEEEAPQKPSKKQIAAPDDLDDEPEAQKQASSTKRAEGE